MTYQKCKMIAEIGAVHLGSMERARRLIHMAAACGVDYIKFQKRNPIESVPNELKNQPHPNSDFAYGSTYLEHRLTLELSIDQHAELKMLCEKEGSQYSCSVWDLTSATEIISINPHFIKIPSACNHNYSLMSYIFNNFQGDVHVSTGMSDKASTQQLLQFLARWPNRVVVYHCTSIYPCSFDKLNLLEIEELCAIKKIGMRVGFSNHGYGIAADIAAYVLGAEYIERHFIDDRTIKHSDAAASLEPEGLRKLCRDLQNVQLALTYKNEQMYTEEYEQLNKLRVFE